jgi:hypothetical protein
MMTSAPDDYLAGAHGFMTPASALSEQPLDSPSSAAEVGGALASALEYARLGVRVFPVSKSKKPLIKYWPEKATTDETQLRRLWARSPDADAAWAVPEEIVVVDLDVKDGAGGISAFERLMGVAVD